MIRLPIRTESLRRAALMALLASMLMVRNGGAAEPTQADRVLARSLFDQARKLMAEKKHAEACPKFAEAMRLDPGGGTQLNLAICYQEQGRTATAWMEFKDALSKARADGRADREKIAQERIAALEPKLSKVTLEVAPASEAPNLEVTLDGRLIGKASWGTPIPIDPGEHSVTATASGKKPWSTKVVIGASADLRTIKVPALESSEQAAAAPTPVGTATPTSAAPAAATVPQPAPEDTARGNGRRTLAYVIGGAGVVALGVGGYFGLKASSKWSEAKNDHCPGGECDDQAPVIEDEARKAALGANIGIGLGIVGVGVGTYLLLTSGTSKAAAPPVTGLPRGARSFSMRVTPVGGPGGGGLIVGGAW